MGSALRILWAAKISLENMTKRSAMRWARIIAISWLLLRALGLHQYAAFAASMHCPSPVTSAGSPSPSPSPSSGLPSPSPASPMSESGTLQMYYIINHKQVSHSKYSRLCLSRSRMFDYCLSQRSIPNIFPLFFFFFTSYLAFVEFSLSQSYFFRRDLT